MCAVAFPLLLRSLVMRMKLTRFRQAALLSLEIQVQLSYSQLE